MLISDGSWSVIRWLLSRMLIPLFSGTGFVIMTVAVEYAKMYHRRRIAKERQFSDLLMRQLECSSLNKMVDPRSRRSRLSKGANLFEAYKRSPTLFGNTIPRPGGNFGVLGSPDSSACNFESLPSSFDYHAVQRALESSYLLDSSIKIDVFNSDEWHNINDEEVFIPNVNSTRHQMTTKNKPIRSKQCAASGYGQHRENGTFHSQRIALWSTGCSNLKNRKESMTENNNMIYCQGCHRNLKQWSHVKPVINPTPKGSTTVTQKGSSRSNKKEHHRSDSSTTRNVSELSATATSRIKSSGDTGESCERINSSGKTMTKSTLKPEPVRRSSGKATPSTLTKGSKDHDHHVNIPDVKEIQIPATKMAGNDEIKIKKSQRKSGWYGATESLINLDQSLDPKENFPEKQAALDKKILKSSCAIDEKSVNSQRKSSNLNSQSDKIKDAALLSGNKATKKLKRPNKRTTKSEPSQNFHNVYVPWKPTLNVTDAAQDKEESDRPITSDLGMGIDIIKDVLNLEKTKTASDFTINEIPNCDTNVEAETSNGLDVMSHAFNKIFHSINGASTSNGVAMQNMRTIDEENDQLAPTEVKDYQTSVQVNDEPAVNTEVTEREKDEIVIAEKRDKLKTFSNDYESNELGQIEKTNNVPKEGDKFHLAQYKVPITANVQVKANVNDQVKLTDKDKTHFPQKPGVQEKAKLKHAMYEETQREVATPESTNKSKIQSKFTAPNRKEKIMEKSPIVLKYPVLKGNKNLQRPAKITTNPVPNRFIRKERNYKKSSELPRPDSHNNKLKNITDVTTSVLKSHRKINQVKALKPTSFNTEIQDVEHPTKRVQSLVPSNFAKNIDKPIKEIKLISSDKVIAKNPTKIIQSQVPRKLAKKMDNPTKVSKSMSPDKVENPTKTFQSQVSKRFAKKIAKPIKIIKSAQPNKDEVENTTTMFQSQVPTNLTKITDKPINVFKSTSPDKGKKEIEKSTSMIQSSVLNTTDKNEENSSKICKFPVPEKHDREVDIPTKLMEPFESNVDKHNTIHVNGMLKEEKNEEGQQFFLRKSRLDDVVQSIERTDILQSGQAPNNSITTKTVKFEVPNLVQNRMEPPCFGTTASKFMTGVGFNPFTKENTQTEGKDLHGVFGGTLAPSTENPKTAEKTHLKGIADDVTLAPSKMASNKSEGEAEPKSVADVSFHSTTKENTQFGENLSPSTPLFGSFAALRMQGSGEGKIGANNNCTNAQDLFKWKSFGTYRDRRKSDNDD